MKNVVRSKWFLILMGSFLCITILIILLWSQAAPCRVFPSSKWVLAEQMQQLTPDARIMAMVNRAKLDYMIRPLPGERGLLTFERAMRVYPNDGYLIFLLSTNPYDRKIYYRVALEDGKLLWKCSAGTY